MATRYNPFDDPNALPPDFLGLIAGNPSEEAPNPASGYTPLDPVSLGGVGGSDPVRSAFAPPDVSQNIADFYGGILNIAQPDPTYFDDFPLPGTVVDANTGPSLPVAPPADVIDTRPVVPDEYYDPRYYMELAQSLGGNQSGIPEDVTNQLAALQASVDALQTPVAVADPTPPTIDPPFIPPVENDTTFVTNDYNSIMDQLAELQNLQGSFVTAEDLPFTPAYDDTELRDQLNQLAIRDPIDTTQFLTANDLPSYEVFDPTGLQNQINELAMAAPVDTSQFITAADLPTFQQFDPTGLQDQITALQTRPAVDTSQFLTAADLPTYDTSALENEIAELRAQLNRNTTPTPALTTPTFSGILPDFGGFNVR
tara:strand:- start:6559 stop:7665 length:1107 start_codon:yes stop_codon:yes gene_type:complete